MKIGIPKRKLYSLPTIHFNPLSGAMFVSGRVYPQKNPAECWSTHRWIDANRETPWATAAANAFITSPSTSQTRAITVGIGSAPVEYIHTLMANHHNSVETTGFFEHIPKTPKPECLWACIIIVCCMCCQFQGWHDLARFIKPPKPGGDKSATLSLNQSFVLYKWLNANNGLKQHPLLSKLLLGATLKMTTYWLGRIVPKNTLGDLKVS